MQVEIENAHELAVNPEKNDEAYEINKVELEMENEQMRTVDLNDTNNDQDVISETQ